MPSPRFLLGVGGYSWYTPVHAPQKVQSLFGVSMPGPRSLVEGVSMPSTRSLLGMGTSGTPLVHPLIRYTPWC